MAELLVTAAVMLLLLMEELLLVGRRSMKGGRVDRPTNSHSNTSNNSTRCPVNRLLCLEDNVMD